MEINHHLIYTSNRPRKPNRIDQQSFEVVETKEFKQWFQGINPITNRKIKIGGKVHMDVGFKLGFKKSYSKYKEILAMTKEEIEFYKKISSEMIKKWEDECICIDEYSKKIYEINKEIENLEKWDDYVLFDGEKYGVPKVSKNIHMENDCRGIIVYEYECCTCHRCEDWNGCGRDPIKSYKCSKCNHRV